MPFKFRVPRPPCLTNSIAAFADAHLLRPAWVVGALTEAEGGISWNV